MTGYLELAASAVLYALGIVAQSVASRRADEGGGGLGLLARLLRDRLYLLGFAGQVGGFALAFLARAELPLYLVQAGSSCAVGLATLFGIAVLGWRVRAVEIVVLVVMATGLVLLAAAATPSAAHDVPPGLGIVLFGLPLAALVLIQRRLVQRRIAGVVPLAASAGLAFAVVAMTSRTLADEPLLTLPLYPLAWLMIVAALVGQSYLALALRRGSATSTVATMDATTVVLTSVIGIAALGDRITPGREWWVVLGVGLVVTGVLLLGYSGRLAKSPAQVAR